MNGLAVSTTFFNLSLNFARRAILQIAERREVKGKGEKERYTQLNAEFQSIARRDKKAFYVNNAQK